jgi:hypothetical protein
VGRLRGYGNAIVPQLAAQFIRAFVAACGETTEKPPAAPPQGNARASSRARRAG